MICTLPCTLPLPFDICGRSFPVKTRRANAFNLSHLFKKILCIFREGEGGRKTGREALTCMRNIYQLPPPHSQPGTWMQPRHVPWWGIKLATFWFTGQHPAHWATPVRAWATFLIMKVNNEWLEFSTPFPCIYPLSSHFSPWGQIIKVEATNQFYPR